VECTGGAKITDYGVSEGGDHHCFRFNVLMDYALLVEEEVNGKQADCLETFVCSFRLVW
jgi:hypothetical protein